MNILIVGNGFDLSHYLPTKYDHFMDVMKAIEEKDTGEKVKDLSIHSVDEWMGLIDGMFEKRKDQPQPNYQMNFEELFSKTRELYFIEKTKEFYLTEQIKLSAKDVLKLQYRLELNSWYQYFKNHVEEIKTWIDFEQKIEGVLLSFVHVLPFIERINHQSEYAFNHSKFDTEVGKRNAIILRNFNMFETKGMLKGFNSKFCYGEIYKNGVNPSLFLGFLTKQLDDFIEIFNLYLELVISRLLPIESFSVDSEDWICPNKIFSFNYTNTYQRIHDLVEVEYLHGSHGEEQNIVLGVSDLEDESLKKIKAYGFTKYHQKLFKDTDYLFLDEHKRQILLNRKKMLDLNEQLKGENRGAHRDSLNKKIQESEVRLNLNFYIWGHSLDVSDKDYIIDLFSLNDDVDRNVRVTVYHFNKTAKFDLLNNLLAILGKDKVEHWMKNKWLQFKENPKVVPKSAITLEDLPQT